MNTKIACALADAAEADRVDGLAEEFGLRLVDDEPRGWFRRRSKAWKLDDRIELQRLEDHPTGSVYVFIAADEAEAQRLLARAKARMTVLTEGDLLERAVTLTDPGGLVATLRTLATLRRFFLNHTDAEQPDAPDPRYLAAAEHLAGHPNRVVRRALVHTSADLLRWYPAFADPMLARRGEESELGAIVEVLAELRERTLRAA